MALQVAVSAPEATSGPRDPKVLLSTLWVFAVLNYLYADVLTLMDAEMLKAILNGQVGAVRMTPGVLIGAAVLVETAIAMIPLSRLLPYCWNRWVNIAVGTIHTVAVALSVFAAGGTPAVYYLLFAAIEVACTAFIVGYAWRWRRQPAPPDGAPGR